jgi:hypothetical protein
MTEVASQPYTAFYTAPLRLALRQMDDKLLRLFIALSTYADARGICFPGVRELAATTGYSVEMVIELMAQLEACGMLVYLRRNERDPVTKRQMPNVYAITSALYLARDPLEVAVFANLSADLREKPDRKLPSLPIHNQNQKNQNQEAVKNQNQEPPPQPPTDPLNEGESGSTWLQKKGKGKNKTGQGQAQKQPAQRPSAPRKSTPPRGEPDDLARYLTPLPASVAEQVAEDICQLSGNMTRANARMLVDIYGTQEARAALILYTLQPKNSIPNPAGYIRALLRRHAVSPEDAPDRPFIPVEEV